MGAMTTLSLIEECDTTDNALKIHLKYNHYPPLPDIVFDLAKRAIKYAKQGKWNNNISLKGTSISFRGKKTAPVSECVEAWHLDYFID